MSSRVLIAVGKIIKAFGIQGDLVIAPMTDSLERFKKLKRVFVGRSEDRTVEARIADVVVDRRGVRLRLAGYDSRTAAESIVGSLVFVDETDAIRPKKGSYFIHDLIGLDVRDTAGSTVGILKDVLRFPGHDVYVIERNGNEILIPAVKEFIKSIDLEKRVMTVRLIDGMLEEPEVAHE